MGKNSQSPTEKYEIYQNQLRSLKYQFNEIPSDYKIDMDMLTYEVLVAINEDNFSIKGACEEIESFYKLKSNTILPYLVENKFIKNDLKNVEEKIAKYNTKKLKKILKKHRVKTSGKRERIEQRVKNVLNSYKLTSNANYHYKYYARRTDLFNNYFISYYYFSEFNEFYKKNYRRSKKNIVIGFSNLHYNKAIERQDHQGIIDSLANIEIAYKKLDKNLKKALIECLKYFILSMNPIYLDEKYFKQYYAISKYNNDNLIEYEKKYGKEFILNVFKNVWDEFNFDKIIISKHTAYKYLNDLLSGKDYIKINEVLSQKYYSNEKLKIKYIKQSSLDDYF